MSHFKELLNLMSICAFHTKSAAVLRKRGIGYMKAVFYILIFTLWLSDSKSSRLYEAGFFISCFFTLRTRKGYANTRGATVTECATAMSFCCNGLLIISVIKKVKMQEEVQKDCNSNTFFKVC